MGRREFLRRLGLGTGSAVAMMALEPFGALAKNSKTLEMPSDKNDGPIRMTYRVQHGSNIQVSLLGFGMMRLPNDQEQVNEMVDYAIAHGVNYFDTAPMYMGGQSEVLMGIQERNTRWQRRWRTRIEAYVLSTRRKRCISSRWRN